VWKIDGRVFTAEKDNWRITGEHAGVKTDIRLTQPGQGFFHLGGLEKYGLHELLLGGWGMPIGKLFRNEVCTFCV